MNFSCEDCSNCVALEPSIGMRILAYFMIFTTIIVVIIITRYIVLNWEK